MSPKLARYVKVFSGLTAFAAFFAVLGEYVEPLTWFNWINPDQVMDFSIKHFSYNPLQTNWYCYRDNKLCGNGSNLHGFVVHDGKLYTKWVDDTKAPIAIVEKLIKFYPSENKIKVEGLPVEGYVSQDRQYIIWMSNDSTFSNVWRTEKL